MTHLATNVLSVAMARDGATLLLTTRPSLDKARAVLADESLTGFHYDARFWTLSEAAPRPALPLPYTSLALSPQDGELRDLSAAEAEALKLTEAPWRKSGPGLWAESVSGSRAWTVSDDPSLILAKPILRVEVDGNRVACPVGLCDGDIVGIWWRDPTDLLVLKGGGPEDAGRLSLYRWDAARPAPPSRILVTDDALIGCRLWRSQLLCAHESATTPRDLVRVDPLTGRISPVATLNPHFRDIRLGTVKRLAWTNADGLRTYGDLVLPPDHRQGERHPLIVVQYTSRGFLRGGTGNENPIYLLAKRGFAVLSFQQPGNLRAAAKVRSIDELQRINIKGWAGRRSIFSALDRGVDAAVAEGAVDPEKIGITGMSDGSTTVQFALLNSTRFKAAAISSCCDEKANLFIAGPAFRDAITSWGYPRSGSDAARFWSPMSLAANAARVRTPLLIQVPDFEYRGALETQSALEQAGTPVDMYVFPGEYHVKSGPAHLDAIYQRTIGWFEFWLKGGVTNPGPLSAEIKRWEQFRSNDAVPKSSPRLRHRRGSGSPQRPRPRTSQREDQPPLGRGR